MVARPGDTAGYIVLRKDTFGDYYDDTGDGVMETITAAVAMVHRYQQRQPAEYAVGRVTLAMISRQS